MRIVCQIGYSRSRREGQKVSAFINDVECDWSDKSGKFLTSFIDKNRIWYLWDGELEAGDSIRLEVLTGIRGGGVDEKRTFEAVYVVDGNAPVREIQIPGVGCKGYPLLKGRITVVGAVSEADKRDADVAAFLDDETF
jgi:hypothetical protein